MEFDKIKQLINDVSDSKLTNVDIELPDGTKISMKKEIKQMGVSQVIEEGAFDISSQILGNDGNYIKSKKNEVLVKDNEKVVTSPMVGTFYSKPSPSSEPYVEEGKEVKKGDTLCIVEAMKLMNEIESEFTGKIVEVLLKDGDIVEYGTPLFKIV